MKLRRVDLDPPTKAAFLGGLLSINHPDAGQHDAKPNYLS